MTQPIRPHAHVPAASAFSDTPVDELIRLGLRLAYPLPSAGGAQETKFRLLLEALAQRSPQQR